MYKRKKPRYFIHSKHYDYADMYPKKNAFKKGFSRTLFFLITFFVLVGSVSVYGFTDTLPEFEVTVDTQVFQEGIEKGLAVLNDSDFKNNRSDEKGSTKRVTQERIYTIQAGDTLWSIAQKFYNSGYNWVDIAKANNIELPHLISEGMEIIVPEVESRVIAQVKNNTSYTPSYSYKWNESKPTQTASSSARDSSSESQQATPTSTPTTEQSSGTSAETPSNVGTSQPAATASPSATPEPTPTSTPTPTPTPTSTDTPNSCETTGLGAEVCAAETTINDVTPTSTP